MENKILTSPSLKAGGFQIIPLELIDDPARPMRSDLTPDSVTELVLSIKQMGIIEPLIVKPQADRFEVIAGHRRLLASQIAKLDQIPCIIKNIGREEGEIMKIHENMFRDDISPFDEAKHFDYLIQQLKLSPAKVSQLIGRSPQYVSDRLAIFNYPPELRQALVDKKISFSSARVFARHPDPEKIRVFTRYAVSNGITPTLAEKWVKEDIAATKPRQETVASEGPTFPDREPETPYYHCYLCGEGVEVQEVVPVYLHTKCDNQFRQALVSPPTSGEIPTS